MIDSTTSAGRSRSGRLCLGLGSAAATAALALAVPLMAAGTAGASTRTPAASHGYTFRTLDNHRDRTFNQLLGINKAGVIAGYFGSGMPGHPNKGYLLRPGYSQRDFASENFPHSAQTQVTGLNNVGDTVGFWANAAGANFGFYRAGGHFHEVNYPKAANSSPQVDQLLGINDHGLAVGFYTNSANNNRGFTFNIHTKAFRRVLIPGAAQGLTGPSLTAAAINNGGEIAGFYVTSGGKTVAFVATRHTFTTLVFPHSTATQAFGINAAGEVVGAYSTGSGNSAKLHGFTWTHAHGFKAVNDPHGVNTTTINGVNAHGDLVGFYVDAAGHTDGFLATPRG